MKPIGLKCLFGALALAMLGAVQTSQAGDSPARTPEDQHQKGFYNVLGDYRGYYAGREPLSFTAITPGAADAYGLRMAFGSNLPGFRYVEYAEEGKEFRILKDNVLFIPLDEKSDRAQDKTYRVRPVFSPAQKEIVYTIRINCMTRKAFEKSGGKRTRDIIKVSSEPKMSFGTNRPAAWKTFKPKESDVAFARK